MTRFARQISSTPGRLIQDFAGGAALVVMLVALLNLPGLV